jgi:hypothetical protein
MEIKKMHSAGDWLWSILSFFFMFSALQPLLQQRLLEAARQRRIARFERQRGSRMIVIVHRQDNDAAAGLSSHAVHRHQRF